jgi:hypothetical protein
VWSGDCFATRAPGPCHPSSARPLSSFCHLLAAGTLVQEEGKGQKRLQVSLDLHNALSLLLFLLVSLGHMTKPGQWLEGTWPMGEGCHVGANVAFFLGFTVCLEFALNSQLWGLQAAFCKLESVTDLQLGSASFPVTVTTFSRDLWENSVANLFLCN